MGELEITVIYASQTGNAEAIGQELHENLLENEIKSHVFCADEIDDGFRLKDLGYTIFVCSTTGDGDPPDNAIKLWKKFRKSTDLYPNIQYALLGLGDTNYSMFCGASKALEKKLIRAKATPFLPSCFADDATGLEETIEPWLLKLWDALDILSIKCKENNDEEATKNEKKKNKSQNDELRLPRLPLPYLKLELTNNTYPAPKKMGWVKTQHDSFAVYDCPATEFRTLTKSAAIKTSKLLELSIKGTPLVYEPGDAFGIICPNNDVEVDFILQRLGLTEKADMSMEISILPATQKKDPSLPHHICAVGMSPRSFFTNYADIRSCPKKNVLRMLAEYCEDGKDKMDCILLCSSEGSDRYREMHESHTGSLACLLKRWKSLNPPLERLVEALTVLMPRYYSACSSRLVNPNLVQFVYNVESFVNADPIQNKGVCTGWYDKLEENLAEATIPIFVKPVLANHHFRLPTEKQRPIIMVGPGTGVAPFIGFLQHRRCEMSNNSTSAHEQLHQPENLQLSKKALESVEEHQKNTENSYGPVWLFFGCRNRQIDFLFEEELNSFLENGVLTNLFTAFSRESETKCYVQHLMKENGKELYNLMLQNAVLYICGDAKQMVKDVDQTIIEIIMKYGDMSQKHAAEQLDAWNSRHQVLRDVWG